MEDEPNFENEKIDAMNSEEHAERSPLEDFLRQYSEGNLKQARPQVQVELEEIASSLSKLTTEGNANDLSARLKIVTSSTSRSELIDFVKLATFFCRDFKLREGQGRDNQELKKITFHLIQIAKLLGHSPSQSALKRLANQLTSRTI